MSVLGNIMSGIFGKKVPTSAAAPSTSGTAAKAGTSGAAPAGGGAGVDVAAILTKMAKEQDEDLNWKKSIVDLMKLLKLDSSLAARKQLAKELGYTGKLTGSAQMNIWLHKQVMRKVAENGGKLPASLKA